MFAAQSTAVRRLLRDHQLVAPNELDALWLEHEATGRSFADLVVQAGLIQRETLLQCIAGESGCEFLPEIPRRFPNAAIAVLPGNLARKYGVMALDVNPQSVDLLVSNPFDGGAVDDLTFVLGRKLRCFLGDPAGVLAQVRRHYGEEKEAIETSETGLVDAGASTNTGQADPTGGEIGGSTEEQPIIGFVNLVLARAIRAQASDIHFEPFADELKIRYRVDGVLHEMAPPAKELALPIASRVKVLANLDIAERRFAQDGRIKVTVDGRTVDLRVSTLPTQFGESIVLRILDRSAVHLELSQLGMPREVLNGVQNVIRRPNGIFVVTGPTGSGKTTTLYSALRQINTPDLKILTVEDPVEYEIEGVMQVPVNPVAGLTFATALRSFLRQDPDVVMVGEIRDLETAEIAIQAALTGHLVLSTLHTNDAAGAITRLVDMGVQPFLVASTLEAVLAQRLVRQVCAACREPYSPDKRHLEALVSGGEGPSGGPFFRGRGCPQCEGTGYRGRRGIYEFMPVAGDLREMITRRAPTQELRQQAIAQGMRALREDGQRAVFAGSTTVEEVLKFV